MINSKENSKISVKSPILTSEIWKENYQKIEHFQKEIFETGRLEKVFESITLIGRGGFGMIYKAKHKFDQNYYAIKRVYLLLSKNESFHSHKYFREINALTKLKHHRNVIRLINFIILMRILIILIFLNIFKNSFFFEKCKL